MINPSDFAKVLVASGVQDVAGVPDSLLKYLLYALEETYGERFAVTANEGSAIAHAIGSFAVTGRPSLIFMQNSGLGNAVNPLISLAHREVMGCPMVLLVGWRGEILDDGQSVDDEPQHMVQGRNTVGLLNSLEIEHRTLAADSVWRESLKWALESAVSAQGPVALIVRKKSFLAHPQPRRSDFEPDLSREKAIQHVVKSLPEFMPVVAATGMIGRELFEARKSLGIDGDRDLLMVGGMGHAASVASRICQSTVGRKVVCLDGDGGSLMHLGSMARAAAQSNMVHLVLNNQVHDSVGGQSTASLNLDFRILSRGLGYKNFDAVDDVDGIGEALSSALKSKGSSFIEIRCKPGARDDLGRPDDHPAESFRRFSRFLQRLS